jgi:hypothetical protein
LGHASEAPCPRTSSSFQPLIGELLLSTVAASNLQSFEESDSSEEYAAVTKPITVQTPPVRMLSTNRLAVLQASGAEYLRWLELSGQRKRLH